MSAITEDELMRAHRQVRLEDLTEIDRRRLMHERIRQAEAECERLRENAAELGQLVNQYRTMATEWREEAQALRRQLQERA